MGSEYLFPLKADSPLARSLCSSTAATLGQLGVNPKNINVTPSTGDQITRFVLRVMNASQVEADAADSIGITLVARSAMVDHDAGAGTNGVSVQKANNAMALSFLGASPRYNNQSASAACYEPPRPSDSRYLELLDRQAAIRYVFAACAASDAHLAGPSDWTSASQTAMGALLAFPSVPKKMKVADPPPVSFLLVGNPKPNYMLTGTNAATLVASLRAWGGAGAVRNFYTLNWSGAAVLGAVALNHAAPGLMPNTKMTSLARAIDVIRYAAVVERYLGNVLIVVNVQSGFWYHAQYSGTPTLTLTSNPIPVAPLDPNTALDAELERCHVHLSTRCAVPGLLAGGAGAMSAGERTIVHAGLNGLRRCHPAFAP